MAAGLGNLDAGETCFSCVPGVLRGSLSRQARICNWRIMRYRQKIPGGLVEADISAHGKAVHYRQAGSGADVVLLHGSPSPTSQARELSGWQEHRAAR